MIFVQFSLITLADTRSTSQLNTIVSRVSGKTEFHLTDQGIMFIYAMTNPVNIGQSPGNQWDVTLLMPPTKSGMGYLIPGFHV
jgi:hypothetical protein